MASLSRTWTTAGRVGRVGNLPVRPILAMLLLLVILAAAAFWAFTNGLLGQRQAAVTYQSAPVSRGNVVSSIAATGPITSPVSLPLTFKSSGKLVELLVKIGDKVAVGQTARSARHDRPGCPGSSGPGDAGSEPGQLRQACSGADR